MIFNKSDTVWTLKENVVVRWLLYLLEKRVKVLTVNLLYIVVVYGVDGHMLQFWWRNVRGYNFEVKNTILAENFLQQKYSFGEFFAPDVQLWR